jgi:hypothetical protein
MLWVAAQLATEKGLAADASKYQAWSDALKTAIDSRLYLANAGLYTTFTTTTLDPSATQRFDLLGSALAVLGGVASNTQATSIVASYPHLSKGAPVIWPQQQFTPIYHNRGIWPFVTALWAKAAKQTHNAAAVTHAVRSLMRGAALNLSNMENFEAATGANWLDDGPYSGPVVNSQRQLWSVAGYVAMVHDVIFGMEATQTAIRFDPFVPAALRNSLFAGADRIALSNLRYRGKRIDVALDLGPMAGSGGALVASSVKLNGQEIGTGLTDASVLADDNLFEITLGVDAAAGDSITTVSDTEVADYQNVFGPRTPTINSIGLDTGLVTLSIDAGGEAVADVSFDVYRDGQLVASNLPGSTTSWTDTASAGHTTHSYCYSVASRFVSSDTRSQHSPPMCFWGSSNERIQTISADTFSSNGGNLVLQYGKWHYQGWGDAGHTLTLSGFSPNYSGLHYLQVSAGNGAGPVSTGVTCAVKRIEVKEGNTVVASGYLSMPHLGDWSLWAGSSFAVATLDASKTYDIVISEDSRAINMSELEHFASYSGNGGSAGRYNRVNIAELKVLAIDVP